MYIKKVNIQNFRLFEKIEIDDINIPDNNNDGSGLTILVGENGCGKTTILDAISFSLLEYKSETYNISDLNDINRKTSINVFSDKPFEVLGLMPNVRFNSIGFNFNGGFRSKGTSNYLSSTLVSDLLFIPEDKNKFITNNTDLRMKINNPYRGKRFNETDILYLEKNRLSQTKTGTFNNTRFDRIMEDLNYQYNKNQSEKIDINKNLYSIIGNESIKNENLKNAITKFKEISNVELHLDFIDNYKPFNKAMFAVKKDNLQHIELSNTGSGYEMIFALIYSYYMSEQTKKNMIILIDEPELHLHPNIQLKFVDFLLEISKTHQIIITTHSPLLVKQLCYCDNIKTMVLKHDKTISSIQERKLNYVSANEINFIAFGLATEEYHNELYEELKNKFGNGLDIKEFDNQFFINTKGEVKSSPWKGNPNQVSIHTYIRNKIHHRKENGIATYDELFNSIIKMRSFL